MAERLTDEWLAEYREGVAGCCCGRRLCYSWCCSDITRLLDEIDALRLAVAGRDKALALANAGLESAAAELDRLKQENRALRAEVERLRAVVSELQFFDRRD